MAVSEKARQAVMYRLDGLSYEEIGKKMGVSNAMAYYYVCDAMGARPKAHTSKNMPQRGVYPNLEYYLADNDLTTAKFAELCGISASTMHNILAGKHAPSKPIQEKVAKAIGMSVREAFEIDFAGYKKK